MTVIAQSIVVTSVPKTEPPLSFNSLIADLRHPLETLPDVRKGGNRPVYGMMDAGLSAFSVFFMQSSSFLDYQSRMQQLQGSNNAQSLFGVHRIPRSNQIGNLLDPITPDHLYPLLAQTGRQLQLDGYLDQYRSINNQRLIAMEGTDTFSSQKVHCPCCHQ